MGGVFKEIGYNHMKVIIHDYTKTLFDAEAKEVILPGEDGELSVLNFHERCLYSLRPGQVKVIAGRPGEDADMRFPLHRGLAKIGPDRVVVLIEA